MGLFSNQISVGCDPEVFLFDLKLQKVISSCNKIGGSKENPLVVNDVVSLHEDNVLLEFNITPATGQSEWISNVKNGLSCAKHAARKLGLDIIIESCAILDEDQFDSEKSREFGCEPDFNIYTNQVNEKPIHPNPYFRTGGGHIHVGYNNPKINRQALIRWMDIIIGTWGKIVDPFSLRSELYGKAGCFRPKPYGLEYRTPSNFWLKNDDYIKTVYTKVHLAVSLSLKIGLPTNLNITDDQIQYALDDPKASLGDILYIYDQVKAHTAYEINT